MVLLLNDNSIIEHFVYGKKHKILHILCRILLHTAVVDLINSAASAFVVLFLSVQPHQKLLCGVPLLLRRSTAGTFADVQNRTLCKALTEGDDRMGKY